MINLLPQQGKQELKLLDAQKNILIIFIYVLFCLVSLIFFLFLLSFYIGLRAEELETIVFLKNQELETYQFQDFRSATVKINRDLNLIKQHQQKNIFIGPFLEDIHTLAPQGILFSDISFKKGYGLVKDEKIEKSSKQIFAGVQLSGTASTREVLYSFKKILEEEKNFQKVYFSPDSWTKPKYAEFSVGFEVFYKDL